MGVTMHQLLKTLVDQGGTDLHVTTNTAPQIRVHGKMVPLQTPPMSPAETKSVIYSVLTDAQKHRFEESFELDFSFGVKGLARFRANVFFQRGAVAGAFRTIPWDIKTFKELGLPQIAATLCDKPRGLILVTGPTGSGKSTTLAALIDKVNRERRGHIITIEDPIEFIHRHQGCMINQREVGADTQSFKTALKYALRQDPDVILVGEMRDLETISAALTIAETGHLVFATLHTNSAAESINRIIDAFPGHQQSQVRAQLSFVLEGVVTQTLLPKAKGKGRVVAAEVMMCTPAIRAVIRDAKIHQIYSLMQAGKKHGMQTMNDALQMLYIKGDVTLEEALKRSGDPNWLLRAVGEPVLDE